LVKVLIYNNFLNLRQSPRRGTSGDLKLPVRPIFRLNGERKSWDKLYNCTEPSCLGETSPAFWWLREREPWKRIAAEITAADTALFMYEAAQTALRVRMAQGRANQVQRKTRH
jgi:hypothetical protein